VLDASPAVRTHARVAEPVRAALDAEPTTCQVTYQVRTDDGQRFAGALTVRNTGVNPIPESTLGFTVPGDQVVTGEGARWAQDGNAIRVRAGSLPPGAVQVLPFRGTYHGSNPLPARFSLGATACEPVVVGAAGPPPAAAAANDGKPEGDGGATKSKKSGKK
jgi:hypothetical protein